MDEFLYLIALSTGIIGGFIIWHYSRKRKGKLMHAIQEKRKEKEE